MLPKPARLRAAQQLEERWLWLRLHPAASFRMLFAASHRSEPLKCLFSFFNSAFCTM